jgi:hypothetical protein
MYSSRPECVQVRARIARNNEAKQRAAEKLQEKLARQGSPKAHPNASAIFPHPPQQKKPSIAPPTVEGKILITAICVDQIQKPSNPPFSEDYLQSVYQGLEIIWSEDRSTAFFFATTQVPFEEIGSRAHPLCLPGEVLVAKPTDSMASYFSSGAGRLVRYGRKNLYFEIKRDDDK